MNIVPGYAVLIYKTFAIPVANILISQFVIFDLHFVITCSKPTAVKCTLNSAIFLLKKKIFNQRRCELLCLNSFDVLIRGGSSFF